MPYYPPPPTATGTAGGDLTGTYPNPTIGANKTTNAKLATMANATVKGRNTAGTGDPEDVTMAQLKTLLGTLKIASVRTARTAGNITLNQAATTTWADIFTSAMDLVVPAVASDVIELGFGGAADGAAVSIFLDYQTVTGSNWVTTGGGGTDVGFMEIPGLQLFYMSSSVFYPVVSGDLSGGSVTFRIRYRVNVASTNRVLYGTTTSVGCNARCWAKNLGQ